MFPVSDDVAKCNPVGLIVVAEVYVLRIKVCVFSPVDVSHSLRMAV